MDFTREPIIETIITPKDGCKLVVRSTKNAGQEEYCVDAVEIVSFGRALFYRSLDRPKAFLAPVSDYEILEVREARMVLKNASFDRSIKIGSGRDTSQKHVKDTEKSSAETSLDDSRSGEASRDAPGGEDSENGSEQKIEKKRDKRRQHRKRRGKEELDKTGESESDTPQLEDGQIDIPKPIETGKMDSEEVQQLSSNLLSSLLQPPPTLISETMNRYRQNDLFKSAFYLSEEEQYKPHDKVDDLLSENDDAVTSHEVEENNQMHEQYQSEQTSVVEQESKDDAQTDDVDQFEFWPYSHFDRIEEVRELKEKVEAQTQIDSIADAEAALPLYAEEERLTDAQESQEQASQEIAAPIEPIDHDHGTSKHE